VICAAHPADTFGEAAERLLRETSGDDVFCVNPTSDTFEAMVEEIDAERKRRSIDRWIFWGISGGGWLGELYARRHPEALNGLILESACACFRARVADPNCVLHVDGIGDSAEEWMAASPLPINDAMRRVMGEMWSFDARPWLHEITTPTLVIAGDQDTIAPLAHSAALHEAIAGSELFIVPGGGHSPVMARRADLAARVRDFIRSR